MKTDIPNLSVADGSALSFADAVRMARGCFDYSGGHRGQDLETYRHGIQTVLNVLEAAQKRGLEDTQVCAIYRVGHAAGRPNDQGSNAGADAAQKERKTYE